MRHWLVSRLCQQQVSMWGCVSITPSPRARGEALPFGTRVEDLSLPSTNCSLHTGEGLTKQLLLFTQKFCPGAAENEGQLSGLPSALLVQPEQPSLDQDVPWQGYRAHSVLKLCIHGEDHPGSDLSCTQSHQPLAMPAEKQWLPLQPPTSPRQYVCHGWAARQGNGSAG